MSQVFSSETSSLLDELAVAYKDVCVGYIAEVGKLGSQNNGLTLQWMAKSNSGRHMRKVLKKLKKCHLDSDRRSKYLLLREVYALKPGVHERFYSKEHEGKILEWLQREFSSKNTVDSKTTIFLRMILVLENFYNLPPFLDFPDRWSFPSTLEAGQSATKFLCETQNWKSLDGLRLLDSWANYAPCAINEGPFVKREGRVLFESLDQIKTISISYQEVIDRVR